MAAHHHAGHNGAGDVEQAFDVGVDHLVPVFNFAHIELFQATAESGVVDQDVNLGPLGRKRVNGVLDGAVIADVQVDGVHGGGSTLEGE